MSRQGYAFARDGELFSNSKYVLFSFLFIFIISRCTLAVVLLYKTRSQKSARELRQICK
jgi:hypothetical protein